VCVRASMCELVCSGTNYMLPSLMLPTCTGTRTAPNHIQVQGQHKSHATISHVAYLHRYKDSTKTAFKSSTRLECMMQARKGGMVQANGMVQARKGGVHDAGKGGGLLQASLHVASA